jgi:hypothetical protein
MVESDAAADDDDENENGTDGGNDSEGEFEEYSRDRSMDVSQCKLFVRIAGRENSVNSRSFVGFLLSRNSIMVTNRTISIKTRIH